MHELEPKLIMVFMCVRPSIFFLVDPTSFWQFECIHTLKQTAGDLRSLHTLCPHTPTKPIIILFKFYNLFIFIYFIYLFSRNVKNALQLNYQLYLCCYTYAFIIVKKPAKNTLMKASKN